MKPGDHVVLVDDDWQASLNSKIRRLALRCPELFPVRGMVYTVALAVNHPKAGLSIKLEELKGRQPHWYSGRFRKLSRITPEHFALTKEKING